MLLLLLTACGGRRGEVRIRGRFDNLPQADLLLFSPDGGLERIDTLHIVKGRFDYRTSVPDDEPYTFTIVYPNYSTLSFLAHGGADVSVRGDALSLAQVAVEGADSVLPAREAPKPGPLAVGRKMPRTKVIPRPKGHYLLVSFWAGWKTGSESVNYHTRLALDEHRDSLRAFSYSLDVDPSAYRLPESVEDTLRWKTYCDFRGWGGPVLTKLGVRNIPLMLLLDPQGTILAMGSDYSRDIKPAMQKIP